MLLLTIAFIVQRILLRLVKVFVSLLNKFLGLRLDCISIGRLSEGFLVIVVNFFLYQIIFRTVLQAFAEGANQGKRSLLNISS